MQMLTPPPPPRRSPSSRAHLKQLADSLFDSEAADLIALAIQLAKAGDSVLLRWAIDRIVPPSRGTVIVVPDVPTIRTVADAVAALGQLCDALAAGRVTDTEAAALADLLQRFINASEVGDLAKRLESVEKAIEDARGLNAHRDPDWK